MCETARFFRILFDYCQWLLKLQRRALIFHFFARQRALDTAANQAEFFSAIRITP
jgi:hypothetical protein